LAIAASLTPRERAVYVLRTAFDLPCREIAPVVERSPEHCRQILHRARARLTDPPADGHAAGPTDPAAHRRLLEAFLRAPARATSPGCGAPAARRRGRVERQRGIGRAPPGPGVDHVLRFFAGTFGRASAFEVRQVTVNGTPAAGHPGTPA
jgi:RNA polymerase sigma-70 factor, ECF subfamily